MIIIEIPFDLATVGESHLFEPDAIYITILKTSVDFVLRVAIHSIEAIRTINEKVRTRRMM